MQLPPELTSSIGLRLQRVQAEPFLMGCACDAPGWRSWEGPPRPVTLRYDYLLGVTPVTQQHYAAVTGANPTRFPEAGDQAAADSISWQDAVSFCERLTELDQSRGCLPQDWSYRLPNEAQWEFACRAGDQGEVLVPDSAWFADNADGSPQPVGLKTANRWGFHDMLGNVWEWCANPFHSSQGTRAVRGASWFNSAGACRPYQRDGWLPTNRGRYVGLRVMTCPSDWVEEPSYFDAAQMRPVASLHGALAAGDQQTAEELHRADPTIVSCPDEIPPPLHWTIYQQRPDMARWLIEKGADLALEDQDHGTTPLVCATIMGQREIIRLLVAAGAPTDGAREAVERGLRGDFEEFGLSATEFADTLTLLEVLQVE